MYRIRIQNNFESAHRLTHPNAPEKCRSIHGHSWGVTLDVEGETLDDAGMLIEFGALKDAWRRFLKREVCHRLLLAEGDPHIEAIRAVKSDARLLVMPCEPTAENIARWLADRASEIVAEAAAARPGVTELRVARVRVDETCVNAVIYEPPV